MKKTLVWLLNAAIFTAVGALGYRALAPADSIHTEEKHADSSSEPSEEHGHGDTGDEKAAAHVSHDAHGDVVLTFDAGTLEQIGIKTAVLKPAAWRHETRAYGALAEDPAETFILRAPLAGILSDPPDGKWPTLGAQVDDGQTVGRLTPRLTPLEQVDLLARLAQAHSELESARAALTTARSSYESKLALNKRNGIVSDRALEEARARVAGEQARLEAAEAVTKMFESSNQDIHSGTAALSLKTARGGEVVEAPSRPGEAVEAGQMLLRVSRFDRLLARVEIPAGDVVDEKIAGARIATIDAPERFLAAESVMDAPAMDTGPRHRVAVLRVTVGNTRLRPGMAVVAYLPAGGPQTGVVIPRSAVVRLAGRAWAYCKTGDNTFTRRALDTGQPADAGWFVTLGFSPGDAVVVEGAVALVSEELKPQIELEENG